MSGAVYDIRTLREEAHRCEQVTLGMTDPTLISKLQRWASEYRQRADAIERMFK